MPTTQSDRCVPLTSHLLLNCRLRRCPNRVLHNSLAFVAFCGEAGPPWFNTIRSTAHTPLTLLGHASLLNDIHLAWTHSSLIVSLGYTFLVRELIGVPLMFGLGSISHDCRDLFSHEGQQNPGRLRTSASSRWPLSFFLDGGICGLWPNRKIPFSCRLIVVIWA